jgi:hypothetical protein
MGFLLALTVGFVFAFAAALIVRSRPRARGGRGTTLHIPPRR